MKLNLLRILSVAIGLLIVSPSLAATCYITEYANGLSQVGSTQPQVPPTPANTTQTVSIGGTSTQSSAFSSAPKTNAISIICDLGASVLFGTSPTATTSTTLLQQGATYLFGVVPGNKIAVIANPAGDTPGGGSDSDVNIDEWGGTATTLGQKAMAASVPVVVASDQSNLPTNLVQVAGASVATGHGTASGAIRVELPTDGTGVVGLAAGAAIIGNVRIDQTTPGTTNGVVVNSGTTTVTQATGTNLHTVLDSGTLTTLTTLTGTTTLTPGTGATNLGKAEDAAHTTGDTGVAAWGVFTDGTTALAAAGDYSVSARDAAGNERMVRQPTSEAAIGITPVITSAAASSKVLKASAGNLYGFSCTSGASAGVCYVFDATSLPGNGAITPVDCYIVAATQSIAVNYDPPLVMATGATIGFGTGTNCFSLAASTTAFISGEAK